MSCREQLALTSNTAFIWLMPKMMTYWDMSFQRMSFVSTGTSFYNFDVNNFLISQPIWLSKSNTKFDFYRFGINLNMTTWKCKSPYACNKWLCLCYHKVLDICVVDILPIDISFTIMYILVLGVSVLFACKCLQIQCLVEI